MKIDNYCIALIVLVLFLIYVDNTNNIEGYAEIGKEPIHHKQEQPGHDEQRGYGDDDNGTDEGNERTVQDYEVVGQKPQKVTMDAPPSMMPTMGTLMGAPVGTGDPTTMEDYMLIGKDQGVYDVIGADLPSPYPRVGAPDNLGQDTDFVSELLEDDGVMGTYSGDVSYHEFGRDGRDERDEDDDDDYDDRVVQPTQEAREDRDASSGGELRVIVVYAPWCGWSKKSLPDFTKMDSKLNSLSTAETNGWSVSAEVYDSDTPEGKEKVKEYDVEGFPTVIVEVNGQRQDGPRSYDEMMELVSSITGAQIN